MPRLVADLYPWHPSAARVCVGQSEYPGLLNGSCGQVPLLAAIDSGAPLLYYTPYPEQNGRGRQEQALFAPCLLRSKKVGTHQSRATNPARAAPIASERYSLLFGASAPVPSPHKNWSPDSPRGSRLSFEWIAAGFTAVCFWNAPSHLGAGRPRAVQACPGLHTGPIESE